MARSQSHGCPERVSRPPPPEASRHPPPAVEVKTGPLPGEKFEHRSLTSPAAADESGAQMTVHATEVVRASDDQALLEGSVMSRLGTLRWATNPDMGRKPSGGFRVVSAEHDRATICIDRAFSITSFCAILPIWGPQDDRSIPGLRLRAAAKGGIELVHDDLHALIRITNIHVEELRRAVLGEFGRAPVKQLETLLTDSSLPTFRRRERLDPQTAAACSILTRCLSAVMPDVGGHSSMWRNIGREITVSAEIELATHQMTADQVIERICTAPAGAPLRLIPHAKLQPPAHYPLSTGGSLIDLRVVPAGTWLESADIGGGTQ